MKKFLFIVMALVFSMSGVVCHASNLKNNAENKSQNNKKAAGRNNMNQNERNNEEPEESSEQDSSSFKDEHDGPGYYVITEGEDGSIECNWVSGTYLDGDE